MGIIKNSLFVIWFYRFLFSIGSIKKEIQKYRQSNESEKEKIAIIKAENRWGEAILKRIGITADITGTENIPEGPVLFVSNHQSYLDIPMFFAAVLNKQIGFVAKHSLSKIPVFGTWIRDIRSVFIEREDTRASLKAIEKGVELLKAGFSLVIFPEGTRSKGENMGEFKRGSLRLAVKAGVPVIPVTIKGTYKAFEEKGCIYPAHVKMIIHPPILTAGLSKKEANELPPTVEKIIRDGLTS